jgi:pimeloyl-ACP methyl ester carboxylesterase
MTATPTLQPPSKLLFALELRALPELGGLVASWPLLAAVTPRGDGHPVLVFPGLITDDRATLPLRGFLRSKGYASYGWELGWNHGPRGGIEEKMLERVRMLADRHGRKVSLVGWSLGGIYARQLAKVVPDLVRCVIMLGSPFNGDPRATSAWRLYERKSGLKIEDREKNIGGPIAPPPPVPATAIYSRSDGICAWQTCIETPAERTENIEIAASHCGLAHHPASIFAIADRLAQPEGQWKPFQRGGARSVFFPRPKL